MKIRIGKWIIEIFVIIDKEYESSFDFHFAVYSDKDGLIK